MRILVSAVSVAGTALMGFPASAEETVSPELQAAITAAKAEAELANARAAKATAELSLLKAEREAIEASLPKSTTKGLEGKIDLDKVSIEANMQAFRALEGATNSIASEIISELAQPLQNGADVAVVIRNGSDVAGLMALKNTTAQLDFLDEQFTEAFKPRAVGIDSAPPILLPMMVSSLLGSVADVASFFKVDTKITGVDVTLTNSAVVPNLARVLRANSIKVYYPEVAPINLAGGGSTGFLAVVAQFNKVGAHYDRARPVVASSLKIKELEAKLAAEKDPVKKAEIEAQLAAERGKFAAFPYKNDRLVMLSAVVDKLVNSLNETDASGISNLARLGSAADLRQLLQTPHTYLLELVPQKAGGNAKTVRRTFSSGKDYYSGGVIISYVLFDSTSSDPRNGVLLSGNKSMYVPYARPADIAVPVAPQGTRQTTRPMEYGIR